MDNMSNEESVRRLAKLLGHTPPVDMPSDYIASVEANTVYATGTTTRVLGVVEIARRESGLLVPSELGETRPLDLMGVMVTSDEYLGMAPLDVFTWAMLSFEPADLLVELAFLLHIERKATERSTFDEQFLLSLQPRPRWRLEQFLRGGGRRLLARQPLLAAMALVLRWHTGNPDLGCSNSEMPARWAAVVLSHAVAARLGGRLRGMSDVGDPEHRLDFLVELAQNGQFNRWDDSLSLLVRYDRLWNVYLPQCSSGTDTAEELLIAATGLNAREHMALGLAFYTHAVGRKPSQPLRLSRATGIDMDAKKITAFIQSVSSTLNDLAESARVTSGDWAFLPVMKRPVVDFGESGLLVLDEGLLLDRVTSGLRRYIDDALGGSNTREATAWNQHVAKAFELMIEDSVRSLAPPGLGDSGAFFFTEEDLALHYDGKIADAAVCFGDDWCVFEIVGKRLSARFLCSGSIDAFKSDLEALVFKKAVQLDVTARNLLAGVTGGLAKIEEPVKRIFPCIVCPEGIPWNPMLAEYISAGLDERDILSDDRIQPLAILDLRDMEILELLTEIGITASEALRGWHCSGLAKVPFANYAWDRYGGRLEARPSSVSEYWSGFVEAIGAILNLPVDDAGKFSEQ